MRCEKKKLERKESLKEGEKIKERKL